MAEHKTIYAFLKGLEIHGVLLTPEQEERFLEIGILEVVLIAAGKFDAVMRKTERWLAQVLEEARMEAEALAPATELNDGPSRRAA